jgi:hypothetical protein
MPAAKQQDNEFLGKEMKYFSQAGFDLDRIHIKVSTLALGVSEIIGADLIAKRTCRFPL